MEDKKQKYQQLINRLKDQLWSEPDPMERKNLQQRIKDFEELQQGYDTLSIDRKAYHKIREVKFRIEKAEQQQDLNLRLTCETGRESGYHDINQLECEKYVPRYIKLLAKLEELYEAKHYEEVIAASEALNILIAEFYREWEQNK